jgi:gas vesicle protein
MRIYAPSYVDTERSHMNSVIGNPMSEKELRQVCEERRQKRDDVKQKMRKNTNIATVGIISFGTEAQKVISSLSPKEQDRLFVEAASRIAEYLNTTCEYVAVHRDESAIHAHFRMPSWDIDGMPLSHRIYRREASHLQDIAGEVYAQYGIHRGEKKELRLARGDDVKKIIHRSVRQLHEDLPREVEALTEKVRKAEDMIRAKIHEQRRKIQKNEDLIRRQEEKLQEGKVEEEKAMKRIETYERRAEEARREVEALEQELSELVERKKSLELELENAKKEYRFPLPPRTVRVKCVVEEGLLRPKIEEREFILVDDEQKVYAQAHRAFASLHEKYESLRVERDMYRRISRRLERELEAFKRERGPEECDLFR